MLRWFRRPTSYEPWDTSRLSVFERIESAVHSNPNASVDLVDADIDPEAISWAPGALDSIFGAPSQSSVDARMIVAALGALVRKSDPAHWRHFYEAIRRDDSIAVVDGALAHLRSSGLPRQRVGEIARKIARNAPDANPVKIALALLGVSGADDDCALMLALGRYEEFTLFSAVALKNLRADAATDLWKLAQSVRGWGRIRTIFLLKNTDRADIKSWLLREGWNNSIMIEESAYFCAVHGGLLDALRTTDPDEKLLDGAGEILHALINGGPAEDMRDYRDSAEASRLYIHHIAARVSTLLRYFHAKAILGYALSDPLPDWPAETRWDVRTEALQYLNRAEWPELVAEGLRSSDDRHFWLACEVGNAVGIDVWPARFERQKFGISDEWYFLMQTDRADRIEQVLQIARARLDFEKIGSGPSNLLGLGLEYADDQAADFIVQDLKRFPGLGWDIVKVALRGRTIRLRNMALNALAAWGRVAWPADAENILRATLEKETDDKVRERMRAVLSGEVFD